MTWSLRWFGLSLVTAAMAAGCTGLGIPGPGGPLTSGSDLVSNNSGSIVSNNSGSLTGLFKAPQQLVSNNSGSYRLGALTEVPVPGVTVTAYDLQGTRIAGSEAKTLPDGRFTLAVPSNRPIVVRAALSQSGKSYVFQSVGVSEDRATGSADLDTGSTLATESLLRIAAQKGLDVRSLVAAKLASLSALLAGAFDGDRVGVLAEGQAALLDYTNSLISGNTDLRYLASVLNGYTGLATFDGALYLADNTRGQLLRQSASGTTTSWLGGLGGSFADGPAATARFASVYGMVRASDGTVYFADAGNHRVRAVSPAGEVTTLAGGAAGTADGTGTAAQFRFPTSVALSGGALFVTDTGNDRIRRLDLATREVSTVAGGGSGSGDGPGLGLRLGTPRSVVTDASGALYFIESSLSEIRRLIDSGDGTYRVETLAGSYFRNIDQWSILDGPGKLQAAFFLPMAMAYHDQALYVADTMSHAIRRVDLADPDLTVTTLAGGGPRFPGSADGTGYEARFRGPDSIGVGSDGTVYVGDGGNLTLRAVSPAGAVRTIPVSLPEP